MTVPPLKGKVPAATLQQSGVRVRGKSNSGGHLSWSSSEAKPTDLSPKLCGQTGHAAPEPMTGHRGKCRFCKALASFDQQQENIPRPSCPPLKTDISGSSPPSFPSLSQIQIT
ncbi:hypothetical protein DPEC_G00010740 [Dallia pectoralis]|uniref:Uncharacterized protein n=1 Tax=Dallia pectoralis TaxID=75939 RepID=A0ACC2HMR5_DALPE|nr:hypothetical protein DPEC_G00010740 [Dallia pectoralis]